MYLLIIGIVLISIGLFLVLRTYKYYKEQRKLFDENKHENFMLNMTKVSCCDLCMEDVRNWRITNSEANDPTVIIHAGYRNFRLCNKHAMELSRSLLDIKNNIYIEHIQN